MLCDGRYEVEVEVLFTLRIVVHGLAQTERRKERKTIRVNGRRDFELELQLGALAQQVSSGKQN